MLISFELPKYILLHNVNHNDYVILFVKTELRP
jgi:hypothetical protein